MKESMFVKEGILKQEIYDYLAKQLKDASFEDVEIHHLPTSIRMTIHTTRPGGIIGSGGEDIERLTTEINKKFNLESQLDVKRIDKEIVVPQIIAKNIAKGIENKKNHRRLAEYYLDKIMKNENVLGVEIILDGLLSGSKTRKDKFSRGYMKKSGELVEKYIKRGQATAHPPIGAIGVKVNIYIKPPKEEIGK